MYWAKRGTARTVHKCFLAHGQQYHFLRLPDREGEEEDSQDAIKIDDDPVIISMLDQLQVFAQNDPELLSQYRI